MSAPIEAEGLVRRFGDAIVAVDGVDLVVEQGEIFGFLGPNGAGKSTTVRMLTTLLMPTEGTARVAGHDVVKDAKLVRQSIGVALQDAAIDPLMTGNELLLLQGVLHGLSKAEAKARGGTLLERVGLTAAGDRRVGTYSGGMRRRLDLALSLVHEPSVLFLDEPTTGLDPMSRIALWDEVRKLNREHGTTVFLTTQYLEEADQLAGRIAIIDFGRIVREGNPAELKAGVGAPTLALAVDPAHFETAKKELCARFGSERPASRPGELALGLEGGAQQMTAVVRVLDEIGAEVEHIELMQPTLDDVFAEATGRRLEGAEADQQTMPEVSA
jgi:ABC-2 type transport system ATP-binding protein